SSLFGVPRRWSDLHSSPSASFILAFGPELTRQLRRRESAFEGGAEVKIDRRHLILSQRHRRPMPAACPHLRAARLRRIDDPVLSVPSLCINAALESIPDLQQSIFRFFNVEGWTARQ